MSSTSDKVSQDTRAAHKGRNGSESALPGPRKQTLIAATAAGPAATANPSLYINRELSWLDFDRRVLEEALDERHPLLERVKFFAIFSSNLDEFFMIRVSGLQVQRSEGVADIAFDGMTPTEALDGIGQIGRAHV